MAANHTKLIGLGVGAILAISAAPMYAEARQPSADNVDLVIEFDNFAIGPTFALVAADDFDEASCLRLQTKRKTP